MKKLTALLIALMLTLTSTGALAAPGDAAPFRRGENGVSDIQCAAAVGDTIYLANWSDLFASKLGDERPTRLKEFERPENTDLRKILGANGKLYALFQTWGEESGLSLYEMTVDADGQVKLGPALKLDISQMLYSNAEERYPREYDNPVIVDGKLYMQVMSEDYEKSQLMGFDLADGSCTVFQNLENIISISAYKPGTLLAIKRDTRDYAKPASVGVIDLASGAYTEGFQLEGGNEVYGLCYDAAADNIYYVTGGVIYVQKGFDRSSAQAVNAMPLMNNAMVPRYGELLNNNLYMFYNNETVLVRNVDPTQKAARTLTVKTYREPDGAYYAFAAQHPDVSVVFDNSYNPESNTTQAMMNREDKVDIYVLNTQSSEFSALKTRGYAGEITDETVKAAVSKMYPAIREAISANGKLIALPMSFYGGSITSYNKNVAKKLGLTEETLPHTYSELVDFMIEWEDKYASDFPELMPFDPSAMTNVRQAVLNSIIQSYMVYYEANSMASFGSPELRETLQKLDAADFSGIQTPVNEDGYSWDGDTVLFESWGEVGFSEYGGARDSVIWPFAFKQGEAALVPVTLEVYLINPFSKNQDLAQQYLAACTEHMPMPTKMSLSPDYNEPIRGMYYESNLLDMQKWLDEYKKQLESVPEEEKAQFETMIKEQETYMEDFKKNEWAASEEDIALYRKLAENLAVPTFSLYNGENGSELQSLIDRYSAKQIPMDQFVSGVDQKMRMAMMEGY